MQDLSYFDHILLFPRWAIAKKLLRQGLNSTLDAISRGADEALASAAEEAPHSGRQNEKRT